MYDGRYTVVSVDGEAKTALVEYSSDMPHIKVPSRYPFTKGVIELDKGDVLHMYPAKDDKVIIVLAPGFAYDYINYELDLKTGGLRMIAPAEEGEF